MYKNLIDKSISIVLWDKFYKLKREDDGQAAKDADKEIKQYNALYAAAVKNGYSVTDEQVQAYIDANYAQTECQFRYCGTAIPFLTVRSTAR